MVKLNFSVEEMDLIRAFTESDGDRSLIADYLETHDDVGMVLKNFLIRLLNGDFEGKRGIKNLQTSTRHIDIYFAVLESGLGRHIDKGGAFKVVGSQFSLSATTVRDIFCNIATHARL